MVSVVYAFFLLFLLFFFFFFFFFFFLLLLLMFASVELWPVVVECASLPVG